MATTSITLDWKTTAIESVIVVISGAIVARLFMPKTKPFNLNIGGKYSHVVHALVIGILFAAIYLAMLYAYQPLQLQIAKAFKTSLFHTGISMKGYSQSSCAPCASKAPPPPVQVENFSAAALSASEARSDCVIGAGNHLHPNAAEEFQ